MVSPARSGYFSRMETSITNDQWVTTRAALRDSSRRFVELVAAADPAAMATVDWTVVDTVAHVVIIAWMDNTLVDPGVPGLPVPNFPEELASHTVDTVDRLNELCLSHYSERDPRLLTSRLEAEVERLLDATKDADPHLPVAWLGDSRVPIGGLLAHLVNEILIHGWDIARVAGLQWRMDGREAARFFDVFLAGVTRNGMGRLQEREGPVPDRRISVELRSRHAAPVVLVTEGKQFSLGKSGQNVDIRVYHDPGTLALMLFGRITRKRAVLHGKVLVLGRRPWLLPAFLRVVRFPS